MATRISVTGRTCPYCSSDATKQGERVEYVTPNLVHVECECGQSYIIVEVEDAEGI